MIRIVVKASADQLESLIKFGLEFQKKPDGSFFASKVFRSVEEAKEFLKERANSYIEKHGALTLDDVTAYIIEVRVDQSP